MKFIKEIGFAQINRNKEIDDELVNIFKKAYILNRGVFKKKPKKFNIIICDTEKEIKKESNYYYQKWGTAYVIKNNNLVTRSPEFVNKIGMWKKKDFQNLMNHEMNHVFYGGIYKIWKPVWLIEGLACYIGKNFILTKKELREIIEEYNINQSILDHRYLRKKFKWGHNPRYPIWANFTRYIIKRYSFNRLIDLMNKYVRRPRKKYYDKAFKNIFNISEKKLFNEFLNSINNLN